jgi:hypothetical protein
MSSPTSSQSLRQLELELVGLVVVAEPDVAGRQIERHLELMDALSEDLAEHSGLFEVHHCFHISVEVEEAAANDDKTGQQFKSFLPLHFFHHFLQPF